jgi:hypothetical protein
VDLVTAAINRLAADKRERSYHLLEKTARIAQQALKKDFHILLGHIGHGSGIHESRIGFGVREVPLPADKQDSSGAHQPNDTHDGQPVLHGA